MRALYRYKEFSQLSPQRYSTVHNEPRARAEPASRAAAAAAPIHK